MGYNVLAGEKEPSPQPEGKMTKRFPNLLDRDFGARGPDELWVVDITYVSTRKGFVYLGVVVDAFSLMVVGWCLETYLKRKLVIEAINMAMTQRNTKGVVHHSDHGSQYTSLEFGERCKGAGVALSMGSVGD